MKKEKKKSKEQKQKSHFTFMSIWRGNTNRVTIFAIAINWNDEIFGKIEFRRTRNNLPFSKTTTATNTEHDDDGTNKRNLNATKMGHENHALSNSTVSLSMPQEPRGSYRGSNEFICMLFMLLLLFDNLLRIKYRIHNFHLGQIIWTHRRHRLLYFLFHQNQLFGQFIIFECPSWFKEQS